MTDQILVNLIPTPIGNLQAKIEYDKLIELKFTDTSIKNDQTHPIFTELSSQLNAYFNGELQAFNIPTNPKGTAFQQTVWNALKTVPYGQTKTYQEQTNFLGDPKAIRAVASANGKNKILILYPCHRIIGSNGNLTGFAGGIERKRFLLNLEQKIAGPPNLFNTKP